MPISERILTVTDMSGGYLGASYYAKESGFFFFFRMNKDRTGGETYGSIHACRETFFDNTREDTKHIGFSNRTIKVDKMIEFLDEINKRLKSRTPLTVYRTNKDGAVIVYAPPFWRSDPTRRSFLTLFIRCAAVYYSGDFEKALNAYSYIPPIRPAVDAFLAGNTVPTYAGGVGKGVVSKFWNLSKDQVSTMLRKPKSKKEKK